MQRRTTCQLGCCKGDRLDSCTRSSDGAASPAFLGHARASCRATIVLPCSRSVVHLHLQKFNRSDVLHQKVLVGNIECTTLCMTMHDAPRRHATRGICHWIVPACIHAAFPLICTARASPSGSELRLSSHSSPYPSACPVCRPECWTLASRFRLMAPAVAALGHQA